MWVSPAQAIIVSFVVLILTLLFRPDRPVRPDTEMSVAPNRHLLDRLCRRPRAADRGAAGAAGVLAPLPDRDPDLGPAGDVLRSPDRLHRAWSRSATRHSSASACTARRRRCSRSGRPISGWRSLYGLVSAAAVAAFRRLFLDAAARHLFRDHDADLLADLLRDHLHLDRGHRRRERADLQPAAARRSPASSRCRSRPTTLHWFVLAVVTSSYLLLRRITQSPFGMVLQSIRENEARTRAIGYPIERYKIVAVMLSGPVRRARRRALRDPEPVRRARFRVLSGLGRGRDLQRHRRHRHAGRARSSAPRSFCCCARRCRAFSPSTT